MHEMDRHDESTNTVIFRKAKHVKATRPHQRAVSGERHAYTHWPQEADGRSPPLRVAHSLKHGFGGQSRVREDLHGLSGAPVQQL